MLSGFNNPNLKVVMEDFKEFISKFSVRRSASVTQNQFTDGDSVEIDCREMSKKNKRYSEGSIFSSDIIVKGSISTSSDIKILGIVEGDVHSTGDVVVIGKVYGNVNGANVMTMDHSEVKGNITSTLSVVQNNGSIVDGDVTAAKLNAGGTIKGNINVAEHVILQKTASIIGDIQAQTISVFEGAIVNGKIQVSK